MTPSQILRSSPLDILFENRNKQYGAYNLRKFYPQRLGKALSITLCSAFGVLLVITSLQPTRLAPPPLNKGLEVVVTLLPPVPQPDPPLPPRQPRTSLRAALTHTDFNIVPSEEAVPPSPTTEELQGSVYGPSTAPGEGFAGAGGPGSPEVGGVATVARPAESPSMVAVAGVSRAPEFPGGASAWAAFLSRHLQVPDHLEAGERKTVLVRFWVGEDGRITNFQVLQSAGAVFDNEVIRVLKKMPKWKPALQNGLPVATGFTQPVTFTAVEE